MDEGPSDGEGVSTVIVIAHGATLSSQLIPELDTVLPQQFVDPPGNALHPDPPH